MSTCAISGVVPEVPVVAKTTGYIFERRLILKHLELHQTCPISHSPLTTNDLLAIQITSPIVPPRAPTQASLPQLLTTIQNEYDAMLLETFSLRQQLDLVKKDLAKQYYTLDAANRVIARLYKENKELREGLSTSNPASRLLVQAATPAVSASIGATTPTPVPTNLTFDPTTFISAACDAARSKLSGKAIRSVVVKQLQTTLPTPAAFLNQSAAPENSLTLGGNITLLPQLAQTQFETPTLATLTNPRATKQFSFIPTSQNTIVIVTNDTAHPQEAPTMTTLNLPTPPQSSNVFTTALVTTTLNTTEFPWLGNLILQDSMSDSPTSFSAFIVSTTTSTNQHNIYFYVATGSSTSTSTSTSSNLDWKCLHTIKTPHAIKSLAIHPSQQLLLALSQNSNTIDVYNIKQPEHALDLTTNDYISIIKQIVLPTTSPQYGLPLTLNIHPDSLLLVIGYSQQGVFQTYNIATGAFTSFVQASPTDFPHPITDVILPLSATTTIAVSVGNGFQVWALAKSALTYAVQLKGLGSVVVDQSGSFLFAAVKNEIFIYTLKSPDQVATITIPDTDFVINKLIVQHDNKALMVVGQKKVFLVYPNLG